MISNKILNIIKKVLPHFAFWGGFFLIFVYQNPNASWQDYLVNLKFLGLLSIAIYINLYLLLPLFFSKKYFLYFALLIINVLLVAFLLTISIGNFTNPEKGTSFLQNVINVFSIILLTSGLKFFRDNNRKQIQIKALENAKLKAELSLLKAQINPHFFFNSLNNLYGMILHHRNQQATETILKLSDLMRYILESNQQETVSLQSEITFLQNYLALEKIRISQEIDIQFETSLSDIQIEIPPLLFIALVENVFKHAVTQHTHKGFAYFSLSLQDKQLFFEAKNSRSKHYLAETQKSGRGLENLQKRLDILYPQKHTLNIEKSEEIYQVNLFIEL